MNNSIFEYKPVLKYVLDDVNTIDNIKDERIKEMTTYITNGTAPILQKSNEAKQLISEARANLETKLEGVRAPFNIEVDDILKSRLTGVKDASLLINDGVITYQLYKDIKDDPVFASIEDRWDEYHCGMHGSLEAEMIPYVDIADNLINYVLQLVKDTILYDEDAQARSNMDKLKESELLQVEKYIYLQDEIEKATRSSDRARYISLKKQFDAIEIKLKYRKNINLVLGDILSKTISLVQNILDSTIPEFHTIQYEALREQLDTIERNIGINGLSLKTITYSAFLRQYEDTINLKRNYKNIASTAVRDKTFRSTITDARLYREVAVPSIIEFTYADEALLMRGVGNVIIEGTEMMVNAYRNSLLAAKNMFELDTATVNNLINNIYEKYMTRTMYKIMDR